MALPTVTETALCWVDDPELRKNIAHKLLLTSKLLSIPFKGIQDEARQYIKTIPAFRA